MMSHENDNQVAIGPSNEQDQTHKLIWKLHRVRTGSYFWEGDVEPADPKAERKRIEPWLSALLQAEHVNLLVGNGLTTAVASLAGSPPVDMKASIFSCDFAKAVTCAAEASAKRCRRGAANIEDQIRTAIELIAGLRILVAGGCEEDFTRHAEILLSTWEAELNECLKNLLKDVLKTERAICEQLETTCEDSNRIRRLLGSFLLTFASRAATRERLHIFTTNYDRIIEYGCDFLGLRILDRFIGRLKPTFRASRLGIDLHYNPPGIRGEPRYLEGVIRFTKLHGSIDWRQEDGFTGGPSIVRSALPFGASDNHPGLPSLAREGLIIYPNPAKDIETLEYPYAELFRDFAGAVCQPNAVVVTYGYSFGDHHINRVLHDMLTIPSSHLAIISFDGASGRIERFCDEVGRDEQITLLIGSHFGNLDTLVEHYLPKPAIDRTTWRMVELLNRRNPHGHDVNHDAPELESAGGTE